VAAPGPRSAVAQAPGVDPLRKKRIVADRQMPGMAELSRLIARSCALRELVP